MEDGGDDSAAGVGDNGGGTTAAANTTTPPTLQVPLPPPTRPGTTAGGGFSRSKADALLTFVESACMGLACDLQDGKDRRAIGLYGIKTASQPDKGATLPDIKLGSERGLMGSKDPMSALKQTTRPSPRRLRAEEETLGRNKHRNAVGYNSETFVGIKEPV